MFLCFYTDNGVIVKTRLTEADLMMMVAGDLDVYRFNSNNLQYEELFVEPRDPENPESPLDQTWLAVRREK